MRRKIILSLVAIVFFGGLTTWSAIGDQGADFWSAWGQWVGGVGSLAAAGSALYIAREDWRRGGEQAQELRRLAEESALHSEASRFCVWLEKIDGEPQVKYHNGGGAPVRNVQIEFRFPGGRGFVFSLRDLGPTAAAVVHGLASQELERVVEVVIAEEDGQPARTPKGWLRESAVVRRAELLRKVDVTTSFDLANRHWRVSETGELTRFDSFRPIPRSRPEQAGLWIGDQPYMAYGEEQARGVAETTVDDPPEDR